MSCIEAVLVNGYSKIQLFIQLFILIFNRVNRESINIHSTWPQSWSPRPISQVHLRSHWNLQRFRCGGAAAAADVTAGDEQHRLADLFLARAVGGLGGSFPTQQGLGLRKYGEWMGYFMIFPCISIHFHFFWMDNCFWKVLELHRGALSNVNKHESFKLAVTEKSWHTSRFRIQRNLCKPESWWQR